MNTGEFAVKCDYLFLFPIIIFTSSLNWRLICNICFDYEFLFVVFFFLLVSLLFFYGECRYFYCFEGVKLSCFWINLIVVDMSALYDQFYRLAPHTVIPSSYYACFTCDFSFVFDVIVVFSQWMFFIVVFISTVLTAIK